MNTTAAQDLRTDLPRDPKQLEFLHILSTWNRDLYKQLGHQIV